MEIEAWIRGAGMELTEKLTRLDDMVAMLERDGLGGARLKEIKQELVRREDRVAWAPSVGYSKTNAAKNRTEGKAYTAAARRCPLAFRQRHGLKDKTLSFNHSAM